MLMLPRVFRSLAGAQPRRLRVRALIDSARRRSVPLGLPHMGVCQLPAVPYKLTFVIRGFFTVLTAVRKA